MRNHDVSAHQSYKNKDFGPHSLSGHRRYVFLASYGLQGSKRKRQDRRKSKRLLEIYHRRAEKKQWLPETHIWHGSC